MSSKIPYDYLIIIDLEATCDENDNPLKVQFKKEESEIIEFSWVVFDTKKLNVVKKQQSYCKPQNTPITPFCINLTKITPRMVEKAGSLQDAVTVLDNFVQKSIIANGKTFCFVTHGPWDLKIQFPREAKDKGLSVPTYLQDCTLFDLKVEFFNWLAHHPEHRPPNSMLSTMCKTLRTQLVLPQHSGINDCLTIGNIIRAMVDYRHQDVFRNATNLAKIRKEFLEEKSCIVHLSEIPHKATQSELQLLFSANGLKPKDLYLVNDTNNRSVGLGFAVFDTHPDAMRCVGMSNTVLNGRIIKIYPSNQEIFDMTEPYRNSFPAVLGMRRPRPSTFQTTISSTTKQPRYMPIPPRRFHTFSFPIMNSPNIMITSMQATSMKLMTKYTSQIKPTLILHVIRQLC
ncbi:hypothetical protein K493DRAFT_274284, partial [Basidiobolus meristosporus CBS 931.73]